MSAAAHAAAAIAANHQVDTCGVTVSTTTASLARAFGIVIRQISDLLNMLQDYTNLAPALPRMLSFPTQEFTNLQVISFTPKCLALYACSYT